MSSSVEGQMSRPEDTRAAAYINLKVNGQARDIETFFRIKGNTRFQKLMKAYCDRHSLDINSMAFIFNGRRLRPEQTPYEFEMEHGDEIDAIVH